MKITFRGKEVEVTELADGVCKKNDKIFYLRCNHSGEWLYACAERFEKLLAKVDGDVVKLGEVHLGREGKKLARQARIAAEKAAKAAEKVKDKLDQAKAEQPAAEQVTNAEPAEATA